MVEVKRSISSPAGVEPLQRLAIAPDTLGQGAGLPVERLNMPQLRGARLAET